MNRRTAVAAAGLAAALIGGGTATAVTVGHNDPAPDRLTTVTNVEPSASASDTPSAVPTDTATASPTDVPSSTDPATSAPASDPTATTEAPVSDPTTTGPAAVETTTQAQPTATEQPQSQPSAINPGPTDIKHCHDDKGNEIPCP